ncbi:MAG: histidinol dehydrogenase [Spirochaetes bacterium]|nr:histidinol dehydrogenase [Spirochaetota bacterium]
MIKIKRLKDLDAKELSGLFNRYGSDLSSVLTETVIPIVNDVKKNGDSAVKKYTEKFDKVKLDAITVTADEIEAGYNRTSGGILDAFIRAKSNIEEFHGRLKRDMINYSRPDGMTLGIMYQPIERAAMYVPGGKASYPSSVLMGVIPAQIAGTKDITIITPPDKNGNISDMILAVCRILGVSKIYKSGGAQGIAAAGFGTESITKADIIVGPGNIYVTAAKSYLFSLGAVQIDSMAGPSEVLIIADENTNPKWAAFDLLSQAEHEENAVPILVTASEELAEKVKIEIIKDIKNGRGRIKIKEESVSKNGLILIVDSIDEAINFSNSYGPEHMEFMVKNPMDYLPRIRNVGSLFLGDYSPVAVGDYFSGTNHVLPTGGAARFSSGLSVDTFLRRTTFQMLTRDALKNAARAVNTMSEAEGFADKHGGSVNVRFEEKK